MLSTRPSSSAPAGTLEGNRGCRQGHPGATRRATGSDPGQGRCAVEGRIPEGPNRALFDELKSRSEAIRPQVLASVALPDALERYQAVLQSLQSLREQVATSSGLILDP